MQLIRDTREQDKLEFSKVDNVEIVDKYLEVGDYAAEVNGKMLGAVVERKSIGDLFTSFGSNYDAERAKILKANGMGLKYVLAIEEPLGSVLKGHQYWKGGRLRQCGKDGLAQVRQLMTLGHKYGVNVQCFENRSMMAFWIMEYFISLKKFEESNRIGG